MGRNKLPPDKKKKRLDVYIETEKHSIILNNKLLKEVLESIDVICKDYKNQKN
jgi:hypothetical protein